MNNHPYLKILHSLYLGETQTFRKVHRMIDLFESIIKTHTVVILAEYVKHNNLSDSAKGLLAQGLRTPSLGTWQLFSRVLFEELQKMNYEFLLSDFANEFLSLDKALNSNKTNVIAMRNGYAHGATPSDEQCDIDIKKFDSFLTQLMELKWLVKSSLQVQNGKIMIANANGALSLHPMLLYRNEDSDASFAFFNDLKNDKVGLLNYPLGKHYREKDFFTEFHEYLPLQDWNKIGNNEFHQRIEELTETFKGRTIEREKLLQFVSTKNKGYISIQGNPGIGKSALIAQFFKDLSSHTELKNLQVIEYFIRRSTPQAQVEYMLNYLIRRTDELFPAGKEIRAEGKKVFDLQSQLFTKWRSWSEQSKGQKILFLIDGLDEGVENNLVTYMPRENFENILIIYGARPGGHKTIDDLWATLPAEHHTKLELYGLSKEDIRALIFEVANKYEIDRESPWIDAVQKRSQGNPLYLKLLCDAIANGSIGINDINALPKEIDEYYKAILQRYAQDMLDGDALLNGLFTFAAAKDYLTLSHLSLINKLGSATLQRIGSTLKEVLYENPLTEVVLDYQLFHESFREYLVKEKAKEVSDATNRIIDFSATWKELEGNWEQRYALEHYANHLFESKRPIHHDVLINLIHNQEYKRVQIKTLKSFDCSNRLFQLTLLKASELQQEDHMLEAALCLVDLKYEEANDVPKVIALVAAGEIDLVLQRIDSFGGTDKEGVQRKFILYMLCLMELTLTESKDKPYRKAGIEKLLTHLDEQLPVDHSVLDWNNFFPSYTIYLMACEWAGLGLDYLIVFKRTEDWEKDWIKEKGPFIDTQFDVLLECARSSDGWSKSSALKDIYTELAKQGKIEEAASVMQEALECARGISKESNKSFALINISTELAKQGKIEEAASVMKEALECARGISDEDDISEDYDKSIALKDISTELAKQGKIEEALECARDISKESNKSFALINISTELAKQGKIEEAASVMKEALECARGISDEYDKSIALKDISTELAKQGKIEEAASVMQDALECAQGISEEYFKSIALKDISTELAKQGKIEEALECSRDISDEWDKSSALKDISTELVKQEKAEEVARVMRDALECARGISEKYFKIIALINIFTELVKQEKAEEAASVLQEALECARSSDGWSKSSALKDISTELAKQGKIEEAASAMKEALECARGISEGKKCKSLEEISTKLAKQGKMEEALECARGINDASDKSSALKDISTELAKQGKIEEAASVLQEALECAQGISYAFIKSIALKDISTELAKQGKIEEALECARGISDSPDKSSALKDISTELAKQGKIEEALECARGIRFALDKSSALKGISTELAKQGKIEEALECALDISKESNKSFALINISTELAKQGKIEEAASVMKEALECARSVEWRDKSIALKDISTELAKQGKIEEAASVMKEALECARSVEWRDKSIALKDISTELAKQGKIEEAASVMQDALECAQGISEEYFKSIALKDISTELAKQGNWYLAEKTGLEITQISERQECWIEMAANTLKEMAWRTVLQNVSQLQNEEAKTFYLKGWVKAVNQNQTDTVCVQEALSQLVYDTDSIEVLLQKNAQYEIFFSSSATKEKLGRFNRTLNIHWALDIAAQFPKKDESLRLSTNLNTWLHEIADVDDRDDVRSWAEKVKERKMSEEKFSEKIRSLK
jgi:tetratricopeptide (TPR) repeat protein